MQEEANSVAGTYTGSQTKQEYKKPHDYEAIRRDAMNIEHIALWCNSIDAMKAFYEKYFNAHTNEKYINQAKGFSSYFLSFGSGARLEIMEMATVPESKDSPYDQFTGYIHLAFSVGSEAEVDSLTRRLKEDGHEILDGPRRTGDGYYESVILDPEKNRVEITV